MIKPISSILNVKAPTDYDTDQWESFRRRILAQRPFCECCRQRGKSALQVHHLFYEFSRKKWEYEDSDVIVLCELCHKDLHSCLNDFRKHVFRHLNPNAFRVLNAALGVGLTQHDPLTFCHAMAEFACNQRLIENHAKAWNKTT